jgi:hypothetical protein
MEAPLPTIEEQPDRGIQEPPPSFHDHRMMTRSAVFCASLVFAGCSLEETSAVTMVIDASSEATPAGSRARLRRRSRVSLGKQPPDECLNGVPARCYLARWAAHKRPPRICFLSVSSA